jgi:glycosyltransferase involved in cell wall biosynthesis
VARGCLIGPPEIHEASSNNGSIRTDRKFEGWPVRILIANFHRNVVGGAEKYLQLLIPSLVHRGHSVGLIYESLFDAKNESIDSQDMQLPSWCPAELGAPEALRSLMKWEPDVVYSHGLDDGGLESALLDKYPTILYAHSYQGTCVSGRKCHSWPRVQACNRRLSSECLLLYFPRRCGGLNPGTMWKMFRRETARNARFARFRTVLVASQHMYQEFEKNGVGPDRLRILRLPLTASFIEFPEQPKAHRGRLLFAGRLVTVKGVHYLIRAIPEAAARLGRALNLTVAGNGPEQEKLQELTARLHVNVDFVGWVDGQQRLELMQAADLLAVPSLWPEPFGLVGIEAGSVGLPAVGYGVGGIPDWLIAGESGELAPGDPPTVRGLTDAIVRALANPQHYGNLRRGAWQMAQRFTLEDHLAELEPVLSGASVLPTVESGSSIRLES